LSPKTAPVAVLLGIKDEEEIELLLLIDIYHEVEASLIYIFIPVPVFRFSYFQLFRMFLYAD
jgi:hypothetical protein